MTRNAHLVAAGHQNRRRAASDLSDPGPHCGVLRAETGERAPCLRSILRDEASSRALGYQSVALSSKTTEDTCERAQGKVLIGCRRAADKVRIEVWDSGVGIPEQHIAHIFEEYYQVPAANPGGVGLGLAIVQRLGTLLGHDVAVRSVPGKGSVFSIEVPMTHESLVARPSLLPVIADTQFTGTLLIEDESSVRRAFERFMRTKGISVLSAASANEALTLITERGMRPDLVVTDYNLPGMNGIETIDAVRQALAWKVPAIVLTGDTRSHVSKSIATHDLIVLVKPVPAEDLLQAINRHASLSAKTVQS
jgi:two-component system CheB/CheR fusion protein